MLFSAIVALMTGAAILTVLWPLSRARALVGSVREADLAVYRDQLAEIERDRTRGLIGVPEAEAAHIEISRRLLAAADADAMPVPVPGALIRRRAASILALLGIPLLAAGLYFSLGSPDLPGAPLAARLARPQEGMDVAVLIQRVETILAQNPGDGRGWELVGPLYLGLGRNEEALKAHQNALRILGASPEREAGLGEALIAVSKGFVTPEARSAFERALALNAKSPKALFFLGLAARQASKPEEAKAIWSRLLESAPPNDPWAFYARAQIEQLGSKAP
jgi:cytochrome c-type biogenesis protein CcmH